MERALKTLAIAVVTPKLHAFLGNNYSTCDIFCNSFSWQKCMCYQNSNHTLRLKSCAGPVQATSIEVFLRQSSSDCPELPPVKWCTATQSLCVLVQSWLPVLKFFTAALVLTVLCYQQLGPSLIVLNVLLSLYYQILITLHVLYRICAEYRPSVLAPVKTVPPVLLPVRIYTSSSQICVIFWVCKAGSSTNTVMRS